MKFIKEFCIIIILLIFGPSAHFAHARTERGEGNKQEQSVSQYNIAGTSILNFCAYSNSTRRSNCYDAYAYCFDVYDGDGSGPPNQYRNIPISEFRTQVAECVSKLETCKNSLIGEMTSCCCGTNPNARDGENNPFGAEACSSAVYKSSYFCERAIVECRGYSELTNSTDRFTTSGLAECTHYAYKCYSWSETKTQRCQCNQR